MKYTFTNGEINLLYTGMNAISACLVIRLSKLAIQAAFFYFRPLNIVWRELLISLRMYLIRPTREQVKTN